MLAQLHQLMISEREFIFGMVSRFWSKHTRRQSMKTILIGSAENIEVLTCVLNDQNKIKYSPTCSNDLSARKINKRQRVDGELTT
jgi:hypothetical protein